MMIKNLLYFVFVLSLIACTSDSEDGQETVVPVTPSLILSINGVKDSTSNVTVSKVEDEFILTGLNIKSLKFTKEGQFGKLDIDLQTGSEHITSLFYSLFNYSSNYINFSLLSVDETDKIVRGRLEGNIFHNPLDPNSEGKYVTVDFESPYIDVIPVVKGLKNQAKINGVEWKKSNNYATKTPDGFVITEHDYSDGEFKIMLNYDIRNIDIGTYDFNNLDFSNYVKLAKYNSLTGENLIYNCTGNLNITQKESTAGNLLGFPFILSGNYAFTAVNPNDANDVIQVTEGTFKLVYMYFE